ncbi:MULTISPECIES: tripartite tricarboxylate transporter TctB family protein [unclassified Achromobacter]|uniref:tripartite tricarboxylate transporter TctB family protein n=1 Tax=unclassified Achromobacter TaxID=2626865 RepID=UPI000B5183F6|nr:MULTISPECIES: tripartite tricarboxylate transporter TctB family protein [unclassified Achromobacter]OWT73379.1 tripartite tricarboxylate transporter TctB [Achromobacter sp. HZ34]OWT79704.1 tripartite tricarboxylate transporter TctB [Achromobacter sp. HZ28]
MILTGLGAIYGAISYNIGTLNHMGPGFFPAAVGSLLVLTGILIALGARSDKPKEQVPGGHAHGMPDVRGGVCILLSIVAFIVIGEYGGLLPATFAITFISALGDRKNTLFQSILLSLAMVVIAIVVFWWALQLQLPLFRWG